MSRHHDVHRFNQNQQISSISQFNNFQAPSGPIGSIIPCPFHELILLHDHVEQMLAMLAGSTAQSPRNLGVGCVWFLPHVPGLHLKSFFGKRKVNIYTTWNPNKIAYHNGHKSKTTSRPATCGSRCQTPGGPTCSAWRDLRLYVYVTYIYICIELSRYANHICLVFLFHRVGICNVIISILLLLMLLNRSTYLGHGHPMQRTCEGQGIFDLPHVDIVSHIIFHPR